MNAWWLLPIAYVVGSMPWGLLIVRLLRGIDVRTYGSGSIGSTNVLRTVGKGPAALVFIADTVKGFLIVVIARQIAEDPWVHVAIAVAVIVGHIWPIFAQFRGGKGVATGLGAAAGIDPLSAIVGLAAFVPIVWVTRLVSLGSVIGVLIVVIILVISGAFGAIPAQYLWFGVIVGVLIVGGHRENIKRLKHGSERRLGDSAEKF